MLKPWTDQRRKKKCLQQERVGRVVLPFLSFWGRKNISIWERSFCSIKEVVREGRIPVGYQVFWAKGDGLREVGS